MEEKDNFPQPWIFLKVKTLICRSFAISKGVKRKPGEEKIHIPTGEIKTLDPHSPLLHFLQHLRDEAHHFAISFHRAKRQKQFVENPLDQIEGIGPAKKKALLLHFGAAKMLADVKVSDIIKVKGISRALAQKIYDALH